MKILKERKRLLVKILVSVLFVFMCYELLVETFHWVMCRERDRGSSGMEFELFLMFCPKEVDKWFEKQFLETCAKFDRNLPPNTELLVSACTRPSAKGIPGGEALFVHEELTNEMYLLDLRTGEKRKAPDDPLLLDHGIFLSPELVWLDSSWYTPDNPNYRPHYLLDLTDGKRYELLDLTWFPRLEHGKFDPKYYAYFQSAEQVFIHPTERELIALAPDFRQHPEENVIFSEASLEYDNNTYKNGQEFEKLLKGLGVDYQIVDFSLQYADVPSPTGRYTIRSDGIYRSATNTLIAPREWYFIGWYYDESGVIFQEDLTLLYRSPFGGGGNFPVTHPILKLRLPTP